MISIALLLAAQSAMPIKHYPGWELYRYNSGCSLVGHFGAGAMMQIAEDPGAYRTFIGIRDARFGSVEAGRSYAIAPVPVRDGMPDLRYVPITARGVADGYVMTLKGNAILGSMAKSGQMRFALAGGGSVMTVNYGAITEQLGDLKRCARQTLEQRIGSSTALGYQAFAPMPLASGPQYSH